MDSLYKKLSSTTKGDSNRMNILRELARMFIFQDPAQSLIYAEEALQLSNELNDEDKKARILNMMGVAYEQLSDFSMNQQCLFKALNIAEKLNDAILQGYIMTNLGASYTNLQQYDLAELYFKKALVIIISHNHYKFLRNIYNNLGALMVRQKKSQQAIVYCQKAIEMAQKYNNTNLDLASPYGNMGEAYEQMEELGKAKYYYHKAIEAVNNHNKNELVSSYISIANIYVKEKKYYKAEECLFNALRIVEESHMDSYLSQVYHNIANMYAKQNNYQKAYEFQRRYFDRIDTVFNNKTIRIVNELQVKYETEKKDKEIQLAKAEIDKANSNRFILIIALLFVAITSTILYRNVILKQKINKVLYDKNIALEEKNKELNEKNNQIAFQKKQIEKTNKKLSSFNKDLLIENISARYEILKSKTNPHFLFNSLNTLSSLIIKDSKKALEYVSKFSKLYRNILDLHEKHLITLKEELILAHNYLYLQQMRFGDNLHITMHIPEEWQHDKVPPFSLQLLLENAIKHNKITEEAPLYITIKVKESYLYVENNLQQRKNREETTGIGQKNIKERYLVMNADIPVFIQTADKYIVKLPLLKENNSQVIHA